VSNIVEDVTMKKKIFFTVIFALFLMTSQVKAIESQSNENVSSEAINQLIQELGNSNTTIKSNAAKTLVDIGDPVVDPLISALNDENYDVRENAALVLGKIGNETAIDPMISALSEQEWDESQEEEEFGRALGTALGSFGEPAVEPLSEFLAGKEYSSSAGHAMAALELIGEPAVPVLVDLLYTELRVESAYHLRMIGEPAVDYLIPLLDDEDPNVQGRAAEALVGTSNPDVVEPLTKLLDDDNEYVRNMAQHALESMENQYPQESFLYGREREFFVEDEKREWLSSLEPIVKGRSEYIMPYFYPDGPVIGYGLYYKGYLTVDLLIGSEVNDSYMAEIYSVIDEEALKNGVEEVPVLFSYTSMPVEDVEKVEIPDVLLGLTTDEGASRILLPAGFMAVILIILVIGLLLSRKK
jgi:FOG: HEAT repeat